MNIRNHIKTERIDRPDLCGAVQIRSSIKIEESMIRERGMRETADEAAIALSVGEQELITIIRQRLYGDVRRSAAIIASMLPDLQHSDLDGRVRAREIIEENLNSLIKAGEEQA